MSDKAKRACAKYTVYAALHNKLFIFCFIEISHLNSTPINVQEEDDWFGFLRLMADFSNCGKETKQKLFCNSAL